MKKLLHFFAPATLLALSSSPAWAHPGHETASFLSGLLHPITGIDHLIMLLAFGILVGCLSYSKMRKAGLVAGALFSLVAGLAAGQVFGYVPGVEPAILASLFVVSYAIWQVFSATQNILKLAIGLCIGLVFVHGYAHGVEASGQIGAFSVGMLASAAVLMTAGSLAGRLLSSRWLSVGVASASVLFLMSA